MAAPRKSSPPAAKARTDTLPSSSDTCQDCEVTLRAFLCHKVQGTAKGGGRAWTLGKLDDLPRSDCGPPITEIHVIDTLDRNQERVWGSEREIRRETP